MHIFGKNKKTKENPSTQNKQDIKDYKNINQTTVKTKKRKRIGFRPPKDAIKHKDKEPVKTEKQKPDEQKDTTWESTDDNIEDLVIDQEKDNIIPSEKEKKEEKNQKKKKNFIKKDMKGKPVYLEDTGEKLGVVFGSIVDKDNNLIGYKIKDKKSNAVLSFSLDQFDENKDGLIFVPSWYTNAIKLIEKLEFKDKISPELTALLSDDTVSTKELYDIFMKHDDDMVDYIDDAISLKEVLYNRLKVLEKQRLSLKDDLMDLTEKRLIKDIDRREFSQDVMEHRRKVNILDVNIKKCKDLIKRLESTSFGMLGKDKSFSKTEYNQEDKYPVVNQTVEKHKKQIVLDDDMQIPYKEKYYALKEQFTQLEEEYQELKSSVEKLFSKSEI